MTCLETISSLFRSRSFATEYKRREKGAELYFFKSIQVPFSRIRYNF